MKKKRSETFERTKGFMRTHMCVFDDVFENAEMSLFLFFVGIETDVQWVQSSNSLSLILRLYASQTNETLRWNLHTEATESYLLLMLLWFFFFYWIKYDLSVDFPKSDNILRYSFQNSTCSVCVCVRAFVRYGITDTVLAIYRKANAQCASTSVKSVFDVGARRWNTQ